MGGVPVHVLMHSDLRKSARRAGPNKGCWEQGAMRHNVQAEGKAELELMQNQKASLCCAGLCPALLHRSAEVPCPTGESSPLSQRDETTWGDGSET